MFSAISREKRKLNRNIKKYNIINIKEQENFFCSFLHSKVRKENVCQKLNTGENVW